jgi:hypothetical protein
MHQYVASSYLVASLSVRTIARKRRNYLEIKTTETLASERASVCVRTETCIGWTTLSWNHTDEISMGLLLHICNNPCKDNKWQQWHNAKIKNNEGEQLKKWHLSVGGFFFAFFPLQQNSNDMFVIKKKKFQPKENKCSGGELK